MKRAIVLGLAGCLFACGCYDSKAPLSDPGEAKVDERLFGVWRSSEDEATSDFHIGLAGDKYPSSILRIIEVTRVKNELTPATEYLAFTTTLQGTNYLNVVTDGDKTRAFDKTGWKTDAVEGYSFFRYKIDGDKLTIWIVDLDAKKQAIKSGKVKGTINYGGDHFTDTTETVAKFVAASGDKFFDVKEPMHMERLDGGKQ